MENMDEVVVAHTSLFFVSETYAKLVGDTAERVEQWVRDDATVRAVKAAQAWEDATQALKEMTQHEQAESVVTSIISSWLQGGANSNDPSLRRKRWGLQCIQ